MDRNYHTALDKIRATEQFQSETVRAMQQAVNGRHRLRFIPALAAALALVIGLGAVFFAAPRHSHGFSVTAAAADTALSDDVYTTLGTFEMNGEGGYSNSCHDDYASETHEFDIDFVIQGEDIDAVTYTMNNGRIIVSDSSDKIIDYVDRQSSWEAGGKYPDYGTVIEGSSFYKSVTCAYDDQFNHADDGLMISFGLVGKASERLAENYGISRKMVSDNRNDLAPAEEIAEHYNEQFAEFFDADALNITVTYTDGRRETRVVRFGTDTQVTLHEEPSVLFKINPKTGEYAVCHSLDEYDEASRSSDYWTEGTALFGLGDMAPDADGYYTYTTTEWTGEEVGEGERIAKSYRFTEDDILTVYQWGVDYRLTAKTA